MSDSPEQKAVPEHIEQQAAEWVLRRDRGLTAAEQDEFSHWLAADPRHGAQLARHRRHWHRLDQLAQWRPEHAARPNPDLLAPRTLRLGSRRWIITALLPLAAAVAVGFYLFKTPPAALSPPRAQAPVAAVAPTLVSLRTLVDGSVVELNRDADIALEFTPHERRIRLVRGEAHFTVAKDSARPFVVTAGAIGVRATGTAFNVRLDTTVVEVLVTEGQVQLQASAPAAATGVAPVVVDAPAPLVPALSARQRAVVSLAHPTQLPQIATLMPGEIARVLAWQHRLLDFNATPLREIVAEFNRRNAVQLILAAPELAELRISASFRSENVDGFVHLMEAGFGLRADRSGGTEIILRKEP